MAVPNSSHTVTLSQQDIGEGSFGCRTLNLRKQFRVEENDVIGACLVEGAALNMVSVTHLHQSAINSHRDCSAIGNIDRSIDIFRLHLQADISEFNMKTYIHRATGDTSSHACLVAFHWRGSELSLQRIYELLSCTGGH